MSAMKFESVVKSEGCQSDGDFIASKDEFESVVKSEGCQSKHRTSTCFR